MQGFLQQLAANDAERAALLEAMQVLTHFSRALEQPSFKPGFYNPLATGSTPAFPVFTRPGIVPPAGRVDDCLYPSNTISNTLLSTNDVRKSAAYGGPLPWEMALGNNRGGNDAWGTVAERGGDAADQRALQDVVNPGMLEVRVGAKADATKAYAFLRADGSPAFPGEALVKKRFALERLSWLTYKGPSALLPATDPLFNPAGTVQAIYNCFGLTWTKDTSGGSFWAYDHGKKGGILRLEELVSVDATRGLPREPDFFELLKAAIGVGSLGKSAVASHQTSLPWDCATWQQVRDRSTTFQLLEIGANLIDQYDADSYPTIVKLPNPDPSLAATANRYAPALFTARGVEDLPYFYRFHWRGIENAVDLPNQPLPAPGGIAEITESLAAFAGSKFKCGTTSIIGIPELWNPHALNAGGVAAGLAPEAFRIAAASETPSDLLDPPKDPANALDKGLSMLPKLGDLPTINTTSKLWLQMVNSTWFYFVVRPVGFFSYSIGSNYSPSWLHTQVLSTLCNPMYYNTANWTWSWPLDNQQTTGMTYLGAGSTDYRPTTLFWNSVSSYAEAPSDLIFGNRVSNYFMAFAPLWRLPDTVTSDATFPKQPMPTNWPAGTSRFSGQLFGPVASPADFPTLGSGTICYKLNDGRFFAWDVNSKNYNEMQWPTTPDPTFTFTTNGYAAGAGSLKYTGGKVVPFPYPAYRYYLTALSDRAGVRREIFESYPTATIPPGTPTPAAGGNAGNNRAVDLRGTELLFSLGNNSLFREPTPLCHPGLPLGSALAAGADNFFSAPPHSGSVLAEDGKRWVGFSLGEVPSQFVVAAKLFKRDKTGAYKNASFPAAGLYWAVDGNDPAMDLFQNKLGVAYSSPSQNWMVTTPAGAPVLPGPQSFYKLRFFQVPVNLAGIQRTQLTIRLQYKEPLSGKWVTYDERLVDVNPDDSSRWSSSPVLGKSELQPARLPATQDATGAVAWIDNKRTLGHSRPFVTSYDPRSPRFGHPMRSGYNWPQTVRGTNARDLLLLNSAPTDPWDAALWPKGSYNLTDRPGNGVVGLPVAGTLPCVVASRWMVPAYWSNWFYYYNGLTFRDGYDYAIGAKPADANGSPQWWAQGKHLVSGRILYQMPSANAADYGWYPRYTKTPPAGSMPSSAIKAGSASSDTAIPAFFNDSPSSYYADTLRMGAFSENVPPGPASTADPNAPYRQAYADPDDVFRRASGGFAASGGYTGAIEGLPMGQGDTLQSANRPVILNRPFRSVAETGHAFRGAPWKNISFFLPETADAALLDVFCLTDPPASDAAGGLPLVAGKVNLNTRQEPVLRALLSGALKDELTSGTLGVGSGSEAAKAAATLLDRTTGGKAWQGPFANVSELAGKLFAKDLSTTPTDPGVFTSTVFRTVTEPSRNPDISAGKDRVDWHYTGLSADLDLVFGASKDRKTQRMRESVLRALVDCGQTRVWNVMLDVIVQAGRLPVGASRLEHFVREGEVRAWVYAAIDRFTGEILDQQVEMVSE